MMHLICLAVRPQGWNLRLRLCAVLLRRVAESEMSSAAR